METVPGFERFMPPQTPVRKAGLTLYRTNGKMWRPCTGGANGRQLK